MKYILLILLSCLLPACQSATKHQPGLVAPTTPAPEYRGEEHAADNPGSLYALSEEDTLFSDSRARRVGDLVVIKLVESTTAKNKSETTADKAGNNNYGVNALFSRGATGFVPFVNMGPQGRTGTAPVFKSDSVSSFEGTGETKRENTVVTSLAARVTRVLPGGVLQVEGAREIRVNEETEYMVVSGLVRAKDVSADNSVLSTQMAEASIHYYGKGVLSDKQKPGWFSRLMDNLWPF